LLCLLLLLLPLLLQLQLPPVVAAAINVDFGMVVVKVVVQAGVMP
jgi:hypothetical protein